MIIYIKDSEVNEIINRIEKIEEQFWLEYKQRSKSNREFLNNSFDILYKLLRNKIDEQGEQLEIPVEVQKSYTDDPDEAEVK